MSNPSPQPSKLCATCGRRFEWRRSWQRDWSEVKYCSQRCRRHKPGRREQQLEAEILRLLDGRARGATICPSEVARSMDADDWRQLMEAVRQAARRLAGSGLVEITQNGQPVDPTEVRGPIRIRRVNSR